MHHRYTLGLILASVLTSIEGFPIINLYKRREGELTIYDHDNHPKTYHISQKATGGVSQAVHAITGDPKHLAKGPVTLLEAMITRWYTPETVIGSESQATVKAEGEEEARAVTPGQRNLDVAYLKGVDNAATKVHALGAAAQKAGRPVNPGSVELAHVPIKGKHTKSDPTATPVPEWWVIMPIVGDPIRDLPRIKAALEAEKAANKEKLIEDCKDFVNKHVVPAVHAALDEWYTTIHGKSGHWFRFGDIKPSHFRWLNKESDSPAARMIDFGTARIDTGNAKPTDEKIDPELWLKFCTPGYVDNSRTPSVKTSSQQGHEGAESSAAGATTHQGGAESSAMGAKTHQGGAHISQEPASSLPMAIPGAHSATTAPGGDEGSVGSHSSSHSSNSCTFCGVTCKCPSW
ncbi:hypothetical protein FRC14_003500 [Serendipita sp. 396]|nr:hypothetical protein FRC14_003500 [Serendipita sp. 396]KAG8783437.1 hypothetical protein FRC15_005199 [Serendipita sp. 397]KAG8799224.1 hypothetical protein FRC16_005516 [Serendipita sp. 398]KAG8832037.1 hypothetical protein FRC18_005567 [Serendipita sp. 400]KAG8867461.1 hypothetical protein FRC20_005714 [Serendipita sp. 405]